MLLGALALFATPLIVVLAWPGISTAATVWVYVAGLVVDVVAFVWIVLATLLYAARASRGELFTIPLVSAVADRLFRLPR